MAVFLTAFLVALALTPWVQRLALRWGIVAQPGGRRRHKGAMAKLGGLPLFIAFMAAVLLARQLLPATEANDILRLRGVVWGSGLVVLGGLLDDWFDLPPWGQFVVQTAGAGVAMGHIIFIEVFTNPVSGAQVWIGARLLALLVTWLWMVGMMNTVNWLDGLDGLAAGVGTIAALLFAWHSYRLGQTAVSLYPLALAGALLGFLPYNFAPARIFLGSAGAYFLGYGLATLSILAPAKIATALLVLAVPILDVAWQIMARIRRGQRPWQGDRGHLHFRLADGGLPPRQIVLGYYGVALAFGLVAIFASGFVKFLMLIGLTLAVLGLLRWLHNRDQD